MIEVLILSSVIWDQINITFLYIKFPNLVISKGIKRERFIIDGLIPEIALIGSFCMFVDKSWCHDDHISVGWFADRKINNHDIII